jgi:hypothetical protein
MKRAGCIWPRNSIENSLPMMETSSKYLLQMSLSIGGQQVSCFSAGISKIAKANCYNSSTTILLIVAA